MTWPFSDEQRVTLATEGGASTCWADEFPATDEHPAIGCSRPAFDSLGLCRRHREQVLAR